MTDFPIWLYDDAIDGGLLLFSVKLQRDIQVGCGYPTMSSSQSLVENMRHQLQKVLDDHCFTTIVNENGDVAHRKALRNVKYGLCYNQPLDPVSDGIF